MKKLIALIFLLFTQITFAGWQYEPCSLKKTFDDNPNWDPEWPVATVSGHVYRKKDTCMAMTTQVYWDQKYFYDNNNYKNIKYSHTYSGEIWWREDTKDLVLIGNPMQYEGKDFLAGVSGNGSKCLSDDCHTIVKFSSPTMDKLMGGWNTNFQFARPTTVINDQVVEEFFFAQINNHHYKNGNHSMQGNDVNISNLALANELSQNWMTIVQSMSSQTPFSFKIAYNGNEDPEDTSRNSGVVKYKLFFGCPTSLKIKPLMGPLLRYLYSGGNNPEVSIELSADLENYPDNINDIQVNWMVPDKSGTQKVLTKAGTAIQIQYKGLPTANSDFGPTAIKASVDVPGCGQFEAEIKPKIFYPRDELYHNINFKKVPNWFFYWAQTIAAQYHHIGTEIYYGEPAECVERTRDLGVYIPFKISQIGGEVYTRLDTHIVFCDLSQKPNGPHTYMDVDTPRISQNIDSYARHILREKMRREYWDKYWHLLLGYPMTPSTTLPAIYLDEDMDFIWDGHEESLGDYQLNNPNSHAIQLGNTELTDLDHLAIINASTGWINGIADDRDWAYPGNQWPQ
jgi:hypothetical protein